MAPPKIPAETRFSEKYRVDKKTGCWLWTAALMPNGYAQFRYSRAKNGYGHRFAYEHYVGPIPRGRQLHHKCENKACVNPEHLQVTTARENQMASDTPARRNAQKTHCKRGHPLSGKNLYMHPDGRRVCRTCRDAAQSRWREENRERHLAYHRDWQRKRRASKPS